MTSIVWSTPAVADLDHIYDYFETRDPEAGQRIVRAVLTSVGRLVDHPSSAPPLETTGFRKLGVAGYPYVVIYRVEASRVDILRIHHAAEDWRPNS